MIGNSWDNKLSEEYKKQIDEKPIRTLREVEI